MTETGPFPDDPLLPDLRAFVADQGLPALGREVDREPRFPAAAFRAMGRAGWLGLTMPPEAGGRGLPIPRVARLLFHLGYLGGTAFAKLALQPEFGSVLFDRGSAALREAWFRPMVAGQRLVSNQITEPGAGSDVRGLALSAQRSGAGYELTGRKSEVAFATEADAAIVYARVDGTEGLTAFLVPQDLPGVERSVSPPDLGERWQRRGEVRYRGVAVPDSQRLGEEGRALEYVRPELTRERGLLAAIYLGVATASLHETVARAGEREVFGRSLSSHQAVAFPLVEDAAHLSAAWAYLEETLRRGGTGEDIEANAALAKWLATEAALHALDHAIQFHGGRGYSSELPFEQRYRDVRSGGIAHGPSEVLLRLAAQQLWPRPPRASR